MSAAVIADIDNVRTRHTKAPEEEHSAFTEVGSSTYVGTLLTSVFPGVVTHERRAAIHLYGGATIQVDSTCGNKTQVERVLCPTDRAQEHPPMNSSGGRTTNEHSDTIRIRQFTTNTTH